MRTFTQISVWELYEDQEVQMSTQGQVKFLVTWPLITTADFSLLGINSEFLQSMDLNYACMSPVAHVQCKCQFSLSRPTRDGTQPPPLSQIHIQEMQAARGLVLPFSPFHHSTPASVSPFISTFSHGQLCLPPNSFSSLPWLTLLFQSHHSWSDSPK